MTENVGEFIKEASAKLAKPLIMANILLEIAKREKESKKPPKKKVRQPPKYV